MCVGGIRIQLDQHRNSDLPKSQRGEFIQQSIPGDPGFTHGNPHRDVGTHSCICAHVHSQAGAHYLQHIDGATFVGVANLELADQLWVLSNQQIHEAMDLRRERRGGWL